MRVIDLDKLEPRHVVWLNEIFSEKARIFNDIIDAISRKKGYSPGWMLSSVASRDIHASNLYVYLCYLVLCRNIAEEEGGELMFLVPSRALAKILKNVFKRRKNIHVKHASGCPGPVYAFLYPFAIFLLNARYFARIFLDANKVKSPPLPEGDITLIDTFVSERSFEGGVYRDLHFGKLFDWLDQDLKDDTFFLPTLFDMDPPERAFRLMAEDACHFLFKERFLRVSDYFSAFYLALPGHSRCPGQQFEGFDVDPLFAEEAWRHAFSGSTVAGALNYHFFKRLKSSGIKLRLAIDWSENQSIDKGFNLGVRTFFPDAKLKGYQGLYPPRNYLHLSPTRGEKQGGVVPDEIAVIGSVLLEHVRRFCPELPATTAPAFRFSYLWDEMPSCSGSDGFSLLIGLPMADGEWTSLIKLVSSLEIVRNGKISLVVKPHPSHPANVQAQINKILPFEARFVEGKLVEHLPGADLFLSTSSSTCVEALALGTPVIVVADQRGITQNPIPSSAPADSWKVCYNSEELAEALTFFMENRKKAGDRKALSLEQYFEPITKEGIRSFLAL